MGLNQENLLLDYAPYLLFGLPNWGGGVFLLWLVEEPKSALLLLKKFIQEDSKPALLPSIYFAGNGRCQPR